MVWIYSRLRSTDTKRLLYTDMSTGSLINAFTKKFIRESYKYSLHCLYIKLTKSSISDFWGPFCTKVVVSSSTTTKTTSQAKKLNVFSWKSVRASTQISVTLKPMLVNYSPRTQLTVCIVGHQSAASVPLDSTNSMAFCLTAWMLCGVPLLFSYSR